MIITKFYKLISAIAKTYFEKSVETVDINFIELNKDLIQEEAIIPKKIWLYWEDDEIPNLIKLCYKSIIKQCNGYEVVLLNRSTILDYIDLPTLSDEIPLANKSDLIRLELLVKYGGIWMDASVFLTQSMDWILNRIKDHDTFLFYSDECTLDFSNPIPESWFIVCPKNNKFIIDWRDEFKKCITSLYPKEYYNEIKFNKEIIQNLTVPDYLLIYISAIVCLRRNKYKILYVSSGSVGHYYNYKYNWNGYAIASCLLFKNYRHVFIPKLIKFTSSTRKPIDFFIKHKIFNPKCVLFKNVQEFESGVY